MFFSLGKTEIGATLSTWVFILYLCTFHYLWTFQRGKGSEYPFCSVASDEIYDCYKHNLGSWWTTFLCGTQRKKNTALSILKKSRNLSSLWKKHFLCFLLIILINMGAVTNLKLCKSLCMWRSLLKEKLNISPTHHFGWYGAHLIKVATCLLLL